MRHLIAISIAFSLILVPWLATAYPLQTQQTVSYINNSIREARDQLAAVILSQKAKSVDDLRSKYAGIAPSQTEQVVQALVTSSQPKVRILIVPGHEPDFGGTEFGKLKERDLVVDLSWKLARLLGSNPKYEIFVSRDTTSWSPQFAEYFKNSWEEIKEWQKAHKNETINLSRVGAFRQVTPTVAHNDAPLNIALRLYGINKWSNENDMDIVLHVHFNDYPRKNRSTPGKYSGFSIYVPESQYRNSATTKAVADAIFKRLKRYNNVSDLPIESEGIIEDQDLIAIGSFNSVNAASLLIEYGYIYEPQLTDPTMRELATQDLAFQTYLGLQDFFDPRMIPDMGHTYGTSILPHHWETILKEGDRPSHDIFALQTALAVEGIYPPSGTSGNECPRTGKFGPCTREALSAFQNKYGITEESRIVGQKTLQILNQKYGNR